MGGKVDTVGWLVIFGVDAVLETAFPPDDLVDSLTKRGFVLLGRVEEILGERSLTSFGVLLQGAVGFPEARGFEVLGMLDLRSRIAAREAELDGACRGQLEETDSIFLRNAPAFYETLPH